MLFSQIHTVVARYLSGDQSLDSAARDLSAIMGSLVMAPSGGHTRSRSIPPLAPPLRRVRLIPIPPDQIAFWAGLRARPQGPIRYPSVILGGSAPDQTKVMALFRAAAANLCVWYHVWRRLGQDAA